MHTPPGFAPSHRLPTVLPGTALAFAYAGSRLVVRGSVETPTIPTLDELVAAGLDGTRRYLGEIVHENRLMYNRASGHRSVNYGSYGNYGNVGNFGSPGNAGSIGSVGGFEDIPLDRLGQSA